MEIFKEEFVFNSLIKPVNISEFVNSDEGDLWVSFAKENEYAINFEANADLMPVVFNLAVVNEFNKNDDGIDSASANEVVSLFKHKPFNIEHEKKEIVGHIIDAYFSESEKPSLDKEDQSKFLSKTDPYYITAVAVVYKHVFPDLCKKITECSDENSDCYKEISTSWEIGFNKFKVAKGGPSMKECEILENEAAYKQKKNLKAFGGTGYSDSGEKIYRMFAGKILPLGGALTLNPAANVKGVFTINENFISHNSLNEETNVKIFELQEKNIDMTPEQQEKFIEEIQKAVASSDSKTVPLLIKETIQNFSKDWDSKIEEARKEKESIASTMEQLQKTLAEQTSELELLKNEMKAKASVERFNVRMNAIDELFKLGSEELDIVVNEVKTLGETDEDFETFLAKAKVLFKSSLKSEIEAQEKLVEEKIAKEVERRLEEAQASSQEESSEPQEIETDGIANASESLANTNSGMAQKTLLESLQGNFKVKVNL